MSRSKKTSAQWQEENSKLQKELSETINFKNKVLSESINAKKALEIAEDHISFLESKGKEAYSKLDKMTSAKKTFFRLNKEKYGKIQELTESILAKVKTNVALELEINTKNDQAAKKDAIISRLTDERNSIIRESDNQGKVIIALHKKSSQTKIKTDGEKVAQDFLIENLGWKRRLNYLFTSDLGL